MYKLKVLDKGTIFPVYLKNIDSDNCIIITDNRLGVVKFRGKVEVLEHYHVIPIREVCKCCGHEKTIRYDKKVLLI